MLPIQQLCKEFGILPDSPIEYYTSAEDGEAYDVCRVMCAQGPRVIKRAKAMEAEIYRLLLDSCPGVPKLDATAEVDGEVYLLMECIPGQPVLTLDRDALTKILDALIAIQEKYWQCEHAFGYERALESRRARREHLHDAALERAYDAYLELFASLPRTLCHDDLLPFNAIANDTHAVLIDWEVAGILPYPTPLSRLLAHAHDTPDALFRATEPDKRFAVDYYYEHLLAPKGIAYGNFIRALRYFILYEYCEWIMLGHKYGNTNSPRFCQYLALARALIPILEKEVNV